MLRRIILFSFAVANLLLVDQVVKAVSVSSLKDRPPVEVIPNLFNLTYVENRGCAWGMLQGQVWPLAAFGVVVMGLLVWKRKSVFPPGGWGVLSEILLYAGILGNLVDRLARGGVVDMFHFHWGEHHFPVFNVADSYITVAAGLLLVLSFFQKDAEKDRKDAEKDGGAA